MKHEVLKANLAKFNMIDLLNYLGDKDGSDFLRQYRHQISIVDGMDLTINCCNLSELVGRWKENNFVGSHN